MLELDPTIEHTTAISEKPKTQLIIKMGESMYLETLLDDASHPEKTKQKLIQHFFKPYHSPHAFLNGIASPVVILFEESLPNAVLSTLLIGNALLETISGLSHLLLAQGKKGFQDFAHVGTSLFIAAIAIALIVLAPFFEAIRFFTRWSSTLINCFAPTDHESPEALPTCSI